MICDQCSKEIEVGDVYYDFGDLILCERCADEYVEDCRHYWDEDDDAAEYAKFNGGR